MWGADIGKEGKATSFGPRAAFRQRGEGASGQQPERKGELRKARTVEAEIVQAARGCGRGLGRGRGKEGGERW